MSQSNITSLKWCWSSLSLSCFLIFIQCVWFAEFSRAHISKSTLDWLLPNMVYAIQRTILGNLNYVQCLNLALMEKASFLALMEYTPLVYSPSGKDKFLWKILFEVVMVKVRDERKYNKKMHCQQKLVLCIIWPVIRACNKIVKI